MDVPDNRTLAPDGIRIRELTQVVQVIALAIRRVISEDTMRAKPVIATTSGKYPTC